MTVEQRIKLLGVGQIAFAKDSANRDEIDSAHGSFVIKDWQDDR